jgi:glycosyltransferase involved in cell wall biosynthesis
MLSILLPTYNYNITKLATDLHQQALDQYVDFEIIVMEDGSTLFKDENKTVSNLEFCQYIVLPQNIGRSAIRNKLADTAKYDHLLFLDCDSELGSRNFIQKYLAFCKEDTVVVGGRIYDDNESDPTRSLILTYGRKRERYNRPGMNQNIHKMFMTPNFLISKSIFNRVRFDETIIGYGHEDTVFGLELQLLGIDFSLIDNPVIHMGLEDNETYIKKNEYALENLYRIYIGGKYPSLESKSKVLSVFIKMKKYKLHGLIRFAYRLSKLLLVRNLKGLHPNLTLFDFYKLGHLCSIAAKK